MIRILVMAWLIVMTAVSAAAIPARAAGLSAGFELGGRFGSYVDDPQLYDSDLHRAWSARAIVEWPAGGRWFLASGVGYEEVGSTLSFTLAAGGTVLAEGRFHSALGYLGVPVCARWRPIRARPLFPQLGPEFGYLERVFDKYKFDFNGYATGPEPARAIAPAPAAQIFENISVPGARAPYYPWALFLDSSIGWEFPAAGHRIVTRARWVEGLTDVRRNDEFRRTTRALEVAAGWTW